MQKIAIPQGTHDLAESILENVCNVLTKLSRWSLFYSVGVYILGTKTVNRILQHKSYREYTPKKS